MAGSFIECTSCHQSKESAEFHRCKKSRHGVSRKCKDCKKAYDHRRYTEDVAYRYSVAANYRSRKYQAKTESHPGIRALYFIARVLSRSCSEDYHVDHMIPLSRGGSHTFNNLQVIPASDNIRKHNHLGRM
jgi:hypothetical protein